MNLQHSAAANPEKTVPAEYVPPMSLHRFCEITGLSKASAWRYGKRGWLRTHLIANRKGANFLLEPADVVGLHHTLPIRPPNRSVVNVSLW
jgi:hypothetical protein